MCHSGARVTERSSLLPSLADAPLSPPLRQSPACRCHARDSVVLTVGVDKDDSERCSQCSTTSTSSSVSEEEPVVGSQQWALDELWALFELAYPVAITTVLEFLPGTTSTILAGHLDSPLTKEYVDATTLATMFSNVSAYSIGFGLSSALDTLASQAYGAQRFDKIGVYFQSGLLVLGVALVPILVANYYTATFLGWLGQDAAISALAQQFARVNLVGIPCICLYDLARRVLQAQGILRPMLVLAVLSNALQVASGYVLAYRFGFGFMGVAVARTLGNVSLPLMLWLYFRWAPARLSQWWFGWDWRGAVAHVALFLRLGVPGMLMLIMEWWAYEVVAVMAGLLPNAVLAVSAHAVIMNVAYLFYMAFVGVSVAANVRIGQHLGANEPEKARAAGVLAMKMVLALSVVVSVVVFLGRDVLPTLFLDDADAIARAASALAVWAPFELAEALNCLMQGVAKGAAQQTKAALINGLSFYAVGVPLAYALAFHSGWGVEGLWVGLGLGVTTSFAALVSVYFRWNWPQLARDAQSRTRQ
ncbi:hypothetical protein PINS_up006615 [Pythium insidiosum]|nr:hypothetical protein PINS_up006615 [Pythium insidiosum]